MTTHPNRVPGAGKRYAALVATLAWGTLIFDFGLGVTSRGLTATVAAYTGYFTLWTNILCATVMTGLAVARWTGKPSALTRPSTSTGAAAAIIIVAAVYNLVLRSTYEPSGWYGLTNEMVHVVLPILFVADWVFFVDKRTLSWRGLAWIAYPLVYMLVALIRGELTGFYPYPFADVSKIGYPQALLNAGVVGLFYGALIVGLNRVGSRRARRNARP